MQLRCGLGKCGAVVVAADAWKGFASEEMATLGENNFKYVT